MEIDLELQYPLVLRRTGDTVEILDNAMTPVAQCAGYDIAFEVVRLANAAYRLFSDLSHQPVPTVKQPRNLGLSEKETV